MPATQGKQAPESLSSHQDVRRNASRSARTPNKSVGAPARNLLSSRRARFRGSSRSFPQKADRKSRESCGPACRGQQQPLRTAREAQLPVTQHSSGP